jgi:hypothetical protein
MTNIYIIAHCTVSHKYSCRVSYYKISSKRREKPCSPAIVFFSYFTLQLFTFDHSPKYVYLLNTTSLSFP